MDPISLCASILAIITTAEIGIQRLRKAKQLWKVHLAINDLVLEIQNLQSTLRDVAAFVEAAKSVSYSQSLSQPVDRASSIINSIDALFSSPPFSLTRLSNKNHSRLVWLRHKNEIKTLFEDLKLVRLDLVLKLGIVTVYGCYMLNSTSHVLTSNQVFYRADTGISEPVNWSPEYNLTTTVNPSQWANDYQQYSSKGHAGRLWRGE